ncbi:hypothetical protein C491_06028 [Natronococcus amylolyticus DSM 10524]|uniref:CHAT domain-containing protein n=1 Tax=Natronococcus amylolyticus DSM 10524 TaxID=1227497 RepID=L9XC88_9EURY|nr:hypothetical protein C491_06028 [Natronococcus amylolyticus DSM 10524]
MTPLPLQKREEVEPLFNHSIQSLYDQPLAKQLQSYLSIPFSELEPVIPNWRFETHVGPRPETTEFLPFIANDLAAVKINDTEKQPPTASEEAQTISDFTRSGRTGNTESVRNTEPESIQSDVSVSPLIRQLWNSSNGKDIDSTAPLEAFKNSIGRTPHDDPIDIEVVCNDSAMSEESEFVNETYGDRDELPFDVTLHHNISTSEFRDVLMTKSDFLHYIGHIDTDGFQCAGGRLDGADIKRSNIKAFFLNGCQSHTQGLHLIKTGSIGGIVTHGNIVNSGAVEVGNAIAKLLNQGFPLYGALDVAQNETLVGQQYYIVGDGKTTIAQSNLESPNVCSIEKQNGKYLVNMRMYNSIQAEKGSISTPHLGPIDSYYVVPGETGQIPIEEPQLKEFFNQGQFPVIVGGNVYWSDNATISSLW